MNPCIFVFIVYKLESCIIHMDACRKIMSWTWPREFFWSVFYRIRTEHGPEKLGIRTLFQQLVTLCKNCLDTNVESSCFIQHCNTPENMKFSIKDFLCKCQQTIFTEKTISEKFLFCALYLLKSLFWEVLKSN